MPTRIKDKMAALKDVAQQVEERAAVNSTIKNGKKTQKISSVNVTNPNDNMQRMSIPDMLSNATLLSLNQTNTTTIQAPDPMLLASRMFPRSDGKMIVGPNPNATYGTTIGLILLLHLVFLYQWNTRKTRRDVLTSYHQLVNRKQIHQSVVALVSHPPADSSFLSRERLVSLAIEMGDSNAPDTGRLTRLRNRCKSFVESLHPLTYGHLSGLPLLTYNSHLLWSCRALEALCPSSWYYARFLVALALVSYLLELRFTHNLLQTSRALIGTSVGVTPSRTDQDSHRTNKHRTMGTPTMLTASLLLIYHFCFPFVAIPILPFLPVSRRMDVGLSYFISFTLLTALSWKSHAVTSVLCGIGSAFLWTWGVTSFLADVYWSFFMMAWIALASFLSLHVYASWMPCIDHVAWDARGRIRFDGPDLGEQSENEEEEEAPPSEDESSRLLLNRRESSGGLRGRVPMMDMEDDIEMPRTRSPSRGLQQRRSGLDSFHHRYHD